MTEKIFGSLTRANALGWFYAHTDLLRARKDFLTAKATIGVNETVIKGRDRTAGRGRR